MTEKSNFNNWPHWWSYAATCGFTLPTMATSPSQDGPLLLYGKPVADHILNQCQNLKNQRVAPNLAVILVGNDPASHVYVNHKMKTFSKIGFKSTLIEIPTQECSLEKLLDLIRNLNTNDAYHGILVQLPLPKFINTQVVLNAIAPEKDVDGFSTHHLGLLSAGHFGTFPLACTPFGIMCLLWAYGISLNKKNVVVVGRSLIVGKPMALLALASDATVTIAHSKTQNLEQHTRLADIVIVAAGQKHLISTSHIRKGAVVIDVGMHRNANSELCGDVNPIIWEHVSAMTPVPGGVGPMTIAMLCLNTALCAWRNTTFLPNSSFN